MGTKEQLCGLTSGVTRDIGKITLGLIRKLPGAERDERPPNLRSQMLRHCIEGLEMAEINGFPDVKMDMLRLVTVFTADSLKPDGSLSTRPFTDEQTVRRGLHAVHEHFPHLIGLDQYGWLDEGQYKALWSGVHNLPLPYDSDWQPTL